MTSTMNEDVQSVVVGSGTDRVAINLGQASTDQTQSLLLTSILIEIGDIEIQIRRSVQTADTYLKKENNLSTPVRPPKITYQYGEEGKKSDKEEKVKTTQPVRWDYSVSRVNITCVIKPRRRIKMKADFHLSLSVFKGPHMWSRLFPEIACKKFQSPIRIYTDQCEFDPTLTQRPFVFTAGENCCQTLENTGSSFQVTGSGHSVITGGPVSDQYQFLQFHAHWGSNDLEGAEHVIDGIRLPGELHIVTWNTSKYRTPQDAALSEQFDGLMVFGILLKVVSSDNQEFGKLVDLFSNISYNGEKIDLDYEKVSLSSFLPNDMQSYFTYNGSLTTPMCSESVRWIVFREKMGVSRRQFEQLRQLKSSCRGDNTTSGYIMQNFRPVMPLNGRVVYRSFS
ncbi:unnamed protein product [Adineta ricciae]|nr:unnamed protein product [Adineta ricciae]